jgi:cytochrome oxidase assembly protein ShyY1
MQTDAPVDFRRIDFQAETIANSSIYHVYKSQSGGIFWTIFQPLRSDGRTIFASIEALSDEQKDQASFQVAQSEPITVIGYVRKSYPMGRVESWVKSKASPEANRYFYFNQTEDWYEALPEPYIEGYYIDVMPALSANELPVLRPDIANNHFDYMLTWWSFALIFIVIYLILHRRAGRLAFR